MDFTDEDLKFTNCPIVFEWCEYKGEVYFGALNYQRSVKARKPMIDLFYCATVALNGVSVMKTVQYDKAKFKPEKEMKHFR